MHIGGAFTISDLWLKCNDSGGRYRTVIFAHADAALRIFDVLFSVRLLAMLVKYFCALFRWTNYQLEAVHHYFLPHSYKSLFITHSSSVAAVGI